MHMCIHKTGQHQPSLKVDPLLQEKASASLSVPTKTIRPFSIPTASATFSLSSSVLIHPLKKIVSTVYFPLFFFILVEKCHILVYLSDSHVTRLVILQQFKESTT